MTQRCFTIFKGSLQVYLALIWCFYVLFRALFWAFWSIVPFPVFTFVGSLLMCCVLCFCRLWLSTHVHTPRDVLETVSVFIVCVQLQSQFNPQRAVNARNRKACVREERLYNAKEWFQSTVEKHLRLMEWDEKSGETKGQLSPILSSEATLTKRRKQTWHIYSIFIMTETGPEVHLFILYNHRPLPPCNRFMMFSLMCTGRKRKDIFAF